MSVTSLILINSQLTQKCDHHSDLEGEHVHLRAQEGITKEEELPKSLYLHV